MNTASLTEMCPAAPSIDLPVPRPTWGPKTFRPSAVGRRSPVATKTRTVAASLSGPPTQHPPPITPPRSHPIDRAPGSQTPATERPRKSARAKREAERAATPKTRRGDKPAAAMFSRACACPGAVSICRTILVPAIAADGGDSATDDESERERERAEQPFLFCFSISCQSPALTPPHPPTPDRIPPRPDPTRRIWPTPARRR